MSSPKVSVLIPTHNRAQLLNECLTVARQSPDYCEIVVVDNASSDATPKVIALHEKQDSRVRSIRHETNIGMVRNFNYAMSAGKGEYLCVVCDDDLILPGNFERKVPILDNSPEIGLAYSPWHMIDAAGRSSGTPLGSGMLPYSYVGGRDEFGDLLQNNHIMMNTVVFRRALFERLGGLEEDRELYPSYDWEMWLRYTRQTQTAYVNEALACVRYHDASASQADSASNGDLARARIRIWRKYLLETDNAPVLNEYVWQRMYQLFEQDLGYWLQQDQTRVQPFLEELLAIKRENNRIAANRFEMAGQNGSVVSSRAVTTSQAAQKTGGVGSARRLNQNATPVVWTAPLLDSSGYAEEARHFLTALDSAGCPVHARIIQTHRRADLAPGTTSMLARLSGRKLPSVCIHVSHVTAPELVTMPEARWNIGRTMFETDRLPDGWAEACNRMDSVWIPSEFNRETFARAGVDERKLVIVPGTIDLTPFDPACPPLQLEDTRGFNFLSVFDWTWRKGWDVLLRAYIEEFSPEEDVALIIKTSSYPERGYELSNISDAILQHITEALKREAASIPDIVLDGSDIPTDRMPNLYRAADCFVLPTRGEGWGRPFMEAMAMGLPTIGTNWSGNTAFMNAENSYLLDYTLVDVPETASRETPMLRGHRWAEPDAAHLRTLMRQVFTNRTEAQAVGAAARADIAKRFSYKRVAALVEDELARYGLAAAA